MGAFHRQDTIRRLVALIYEAQTRRYLRPIGELAREHGCCARTIRRDLEVIERVIPIRWRQTETA